MAITLDPKFQIINDAHLAQGYHGCRTCFDGQHQLLEETLDGKPRTVVNALWSACSECNARALNNAQISDIQIAAHFDGQALIGACLGSRKTGTSIGLMNQLRGVWLIVAPLRTLPQWAEAVAEWAPTAKIHMMNAKNKTYAIDLKEDGGGFGRGWRQRAEAFVAEGHLSVHIVGWEFFRKMDLTSYRSLDGAILDEVHRAAGNTRNARAMWGINSRWRIGLSGTFTNNKLSGAYNVCKWIWWGNADAKIANKYQRFEVRMGDFQKPGWVRRHFELKPNPYAQTEHESFIIGDPLYPAVPAGPWGPARPSSVISEIPVFIQHLEDETCCQWHPGGVNATLPGKDETRVIFTEMTPAQKRIYNQSENKKLTTAWIDRAKQWADLGEQAPMVTGAPLLRAMRLQEVALAEPSMGRGDVVRDGEIMEGDVTVYEPDAKSPNIDALIELIETEWAPGDPFLVLTHSRKFAELIAPRLSTSFSTALWTGGMKDDYVDRLKATFGREGGPQVIVAVLQAVAEGVDWMQYVCRNEVWMSEVYGNHMINTQAQGRLLRTGQKRRVRSWHIITRGTVMEARHYEQQAQRAQLKANLRAV